jgi:hypothetical protein
MPLLTTLLNLQKILSVGYRTGKWLLETTKDSKNKILEFDIMLSPIILNHIEKNKKKNKKKFN